MALAPPVPLEFLALVDHVALVAVLLAKKMKSVAEILVLIPLEIPLIVELAVHPARLA